MNTDCLFRPLRSMLLVAALLASTFLFAQKAKVAERPPMGWNSFGAFGATVKESEVMANAGFMETHLKSFGWQYVVVGYCWYFPYPGAMYNPQQVKNQIPRFRMDRYGRLLPAVDRFPSSRGCHGFRTLANRLHRKGLKFGIHIMRGIPQQAVLENTRIKGTSFRARDIADTANNCTWLNHNLGINMDKPGAQAYYNSLFELYAGWGVDFVKVDDISEPYFEKEIAAIQKAILHCGRPMVLSLASGGTRTEHAESAKEYANMWRISDDFRDNWDDLVKMFDYLHKWEAYSGPGHFADADILSLGLIAERGPIGEARHSNLNLHELVAMMTLWSIARSPLMVGGDLSMLRSGELRMLQNKAVLDVNQYSMNNRQLFRNGDELAWVADVPGSDDKYLAVFNLGEHATLIHIDLKDLGVKDKCTVTDLWTGEGIGVFQKGMRPEVLSHGARLLRVSNIK